MALNQEFPAVPQLQPGAPVQAQHVGQAVERLHARLQASITNKAGETLSPRSVAASAACHSPRSAMQWEGKAYRGQTWAAT